MIRPISLPLTVILAFCFIGRCRLGATEVPRDVSTLIDQHCVDCHSGDEPDGDLDLATLGFDLDDLEIRRRWIQAHDRVLAGEMPPNDAMSLEPEQRSAFVRSLSQTIVRAEAGRNDVVLRRLNKHEYQNTVRDLFDTNVIVHGLPEDSSTNGFDTVGEGLAVSAEAMTAYLAAADQVLDAVLGPKGQPKSIRHETNLLDQVDWRGQPMDQQIGKMFRKTEDGLVVFQSGYCPTHLVNFSRLRAPAGTYRGTFKVRAVQSETPVTLRIYGGDTIVNRREQHLVGYYDVPPGNWTTIEFTDRLLEDGGTFHPKCYATRDTRKEADSWPHPGIEIGDIIIEGPLEPWPPVSRTKLLGEIDVTSANQVDAQKVLQRLLPKAFRRPINDDDITSYLKLYQSSVSAGQSFESAIRVAIKAVLCSPEFLFLIEPRESRIDPYALASRLSYFLWSSMPDEQLFSLAANGSLSNPDVLRNQVERMLKSPRSARLTKGFTGQWLDLREIDFTQPDANLYPEFDELLRISMVRETELFFEEILHNDLSLVNFVDSEFTFLNERLARHYGIDGIHGQAFRKVQLPADSQRGGVLTQASILKVTANGTSTSPVLRGVWILENILGTPTPPPPDNVGSIEPDIRGATTIREQLVKHRDIESCAACHRRIDPPGFSLECFDPIGGYRQQYRTMANEGQRPKLKQAPFTYNWVRYRLGQDVDSTAITPNGTTITDIPSFRNALASDPDRLTTNLAEQLLTYALGRRLGFSDRPLVDQIVKQTREQDYGFRSLVHAVVQSPAFQQP
ncbi:DUF1592 domain-containing protein [Stieleria sp. JC731]|uniref:DUF1592 domain-containing protein n=1 Tax=Stieleria sp. JC731 TaxID=2894195 RepID=UPI001E32739A|nr:DUF1592 domain-containing protein [Stieleria sp. JC731]MCC9601909.1 DUF1592 domain-containing protein [Stieleria sp. JC731]